MTAEIGVRARRAIEQGVARGWSASAIAEYLQVSVESVHAVWDEMDAAAAETDPPPMSVESVLPQVVVGVDCCARHRTAAGPPGTPPEWFVEFRSACSELGSIELACLALDVSVRAAEARWVRHHPGDPMRFRLSHEVARQTRLLAALAELRGGAVAA